MDSTMSASSGKPGFFNYPTPCKGPDVPSESRKLQNPRLKGRLLVAAAFIMERSRFVRETAWKNAGFDTIRNIRDHIMEHEPWFEPTVIPIAVTEAQQQPKSNNGVRDLPPQIEHRKFYSVSDYHTMYLSGEVTPTDVALTLIPLIRRDTSPAGKHAAAWMDTNIELVMKAAKASTLRYREKRSLGVLDGVPTGIKDDYDMDGYSTYMGSLNDYAAKPSDDSSITNWCVKKLEDAGAVILGKLTMNEFGLDTTGNSPIYETPRNPFNPNYYTGGSSSGPGYAVGTGLVPIALGSDGGGSVRIPASYCSVFGLKPTHARLSCHPGANHASTCSVQGPLAADIHSLAAVYEVIADPHPSTQFPPLALEPSHPLTKVLGVDEKWIARSEPGIQSLIKGLISKLCSDYGYHVVNIEIPFVTEGQTAHSITILTDAATLLPKTDNLTSTTKILLALGGSTSSTDYLLAQKLRSLLMQHLAYLWQKYPGMLIITPTTACAGSPIRGGSGELNYGLNDGNHTIESMVYVWLANYCGLPALTVPAGYVVPRGHKDMGAVGDETTEGKVPVGLMATGEWCSESALLKFGIDAEAAAQEVRCKPPTWEDVISTTKMEAKLNRTESSQGTSN